MSHTMSKAHHYSKKMALGGRGSRQIKLTQKKETPVFDSSKLAMRKAERETKKVEEDVKELQNTVKEEERVLEKDVSREVKEAESLK